MQHELGWERSAGGLLELEEARAAAADTLKDAEIGAQAEETAQSIKTVVGWLNCAERAGEAATKAQAIRPILKAAGWGEPADEVCIANTKLRPDGLLYSNHREAKRTFLARAGRTSSPTRAASTGSWVSSPAWTGSRSPT